MGFTGSSREARKSDFLVLLKKIPTKMRTNLKRKKKQQQQQVTLPPPPPPPPPPPAVVGHKIEDEVLVIGGVEVIPLDICSSPEQAKPEIDHLSWLEPVSKPHYHFKIPQESLEKFKDVAFVLKAGLVSNLKETAHKLDVANMVQNANECFTRLRCLGLDYQPFHGEVCKLIKYYQELKEAVKEKNTLTDSRLVTDYENSVVNADDAKVVLLGAEENLISAQANNNLTRIKIKELTAMLGRLEVEEAMERDGLATLTVERDRCKEAYLLAEKNVEETAAILEGIKERYDVTEEEIRKSLNRLRDLV